MARIREKETGIPGFSITILLAGRFLQGRNRGDAEVAEKYIDVTNFAFAEIAVDLCRRKPLAEFPERRLSELCVSAVNDPGSLGCGFAALGLFESFHGQETFVRENLHAIQKN